MEWMSSLSFICLETTLLSSQKSGWSAVTTEPFAGPQTMSQSPAAVRYLPLCQPQGQLTKQETGLAQPSVWYLMSQTHNAVLLTVIHVFFFSFETIHIGLTCFIRGSCCRLVHICVFEVVEKSHHSYSTVCPHSPSSVLSSALSSSGPNP